MKAGLTPAPCAPTAAACATAVCCRSTASTPSGCWDAYGIDDLFAPEQNIRAGVLILSDKVARYGEHGGLMAYNLGDGGYARR